MAKLDISKFLKEGYEQYANCHYQYSLDLAKTILERKYNIDAYMLAGMSFFQLKNFEEANKYLEVAFVENRNDIGIQLFYFENLKQLKEFSKAANQLDKIEMSNEKMIFLAASIYELDGNYTEVVRLLKKLKGSLVTHEYLAWNYENLNKITEAKKEIKKGLKYKYDSFKLNLVLSKLYIRKKDYIKARRALNKIKSNELSKVNLSIYYSIKAMCCEGLKKYNKAFKFYTKSNICLKSTRAYKDLQSQSYYTFEKINIIKNIFKSTPSFKNLINCNEKITFMVGYPRSGTTLLENILNAHSKISTIEEKPLVDDILNFFLETPESIKKIETITDSEICGLQNKYLKKRKEYIKNHNNIIIDKLPLNIIHIAILYRIFPNANFIVSTRDVRDVALSCYFQSFAINDAMSYFLDWKLTKIYLSEIMSLGMYACDNYPVKHLVVKYEELVNNTDYEIKKVIKFLDLEWEESIKDYRSNIVGKNINTPSYASIAKKINNKRLQRWKNYTKYFK